MIVNYFYAGDLPRVLFHDLEPHTFINNKGYNKCYAHKWSLLNRFKFKSPIDLDFTISFKKANDFLITPNRGDTKNMGKSVVFHVGNMIEEDKLVFQLTGICFYTKEKCFLEQCRPEQSLLDLKLITGKFDISKWIRPVSVAFEAQKKHQRIVINRGDVLCEFAFHTDKVNEPIKLVENTNPSPDLIKFARDNSTVTEFAVNTKNLIQKGSELIKRFI